MKTYRVEYLDGNVTEVRILPIDALMLERQGGRYGDTERGLRGIHHAAQRNGAEGQPFDEWIETVADVRSLGKDDDEDPTKLAD